MEAKSQEAGSTIMASPALSRKGTFEAPWFMRTRQVYPQNGSLYTASVWAEGYGVSLSEARQAATFYVDSRFMQTEVYTALANPSD